MAATVDQGNYPVREANKTLIADKDLILERLNKEPASLINALRREQHEGRGGVNYGRKGHIKNSITLPAIEHVNQDNTFKSINELRTIFSETLKHNEVIAYCGGGIAATSVALALDMLGHKNVKVYDASLTEWAADETLPMSV
jgi:thiosulfate/3-mercaptopyruvate sulfurtransferase